MAPSRPRCGRTEFDHDQFGEAYPPGIERSWWHVARNGVIAGTFARWIPRDARVLEVGCGTGIVTEHLRDRDWNVTGVDLGEPKAGLHASGHLLLGTNALELPVDLREGFGALVLFDVIEHIGDAPAFLRTLLDAFPNARHVVITVPARQELWTSFDDHFGHFRRYDRRMLREEFSACGLVTDQIGYFFHGLYPAIVMNNLLRGRKRNIRFSASAPGAASSVHAWLGSIFALEARLLPAALPGSSIIAVARRA
jgi:SAM-dependent methyltransferase